jgi:hypothetical protein
MKLIRPKQDNQLLIELSCKHTVLKTLVRKHSTKQIRLIQKDIEVLSACYITARKVGFFAPPDVYTNLNRAYAERLFYVSINRLISMGYIERLSNKRKYYTAFKYVLTVSGHTILKEYCKLIQANGKRIEDNINKIGAEDSTDTIVIY